MSIDEIFTWVDASYAVHQYMKSHTGGVMSMGLGVTQCILIKKHLNTKSSMKAELVGASDYFPYKIWYIMFMHHQGYLNKSNKFFQDNKSAMKMEVNRRNSCIEKSQNIDIRYFY